MRWILAQIRHDIGIDCRRIGAVAFIHACLTTGRSACSSTRPTARPGRSAPTPPREHAAQPPRGLLLRRTPPRRCARARLHGRRAHRGRADARRPGAAPTCSSSPTPRSPSGSARCPATPRLSDAELDAVEAFVAARRRADRARRDRAGQVRQQPQRAARPLRPGGRARHRPATTPTSTASPTWVLAELAATRPVAGADLLARVEQACFYRAGDAGAARRRRAGAAHARAEADPRRRPADGRRRRTARAASSRSPTPTCSATTAWASSTTARCGSTLVYWAARAAFAHAGAPAGDSAVARRSPRGRR